MAAVFKSYRPFWSAVVGWLVQAVWGGKLEGAQKKSTSVSVLFADGVFL